MAASGGSAHTWLLIHLRDAEGGEPDTGRSPAGEDGGPRVPGVPISRQVGPFFIHRTGGGTAHAPAAPDPPPPPGGPRYMRTL